MPMSCLNTEWLIAKLWLCEIKVGSVLKSNVDMVLALFLKLIFESFSTVGKKFWTTQNFLKLK